MEPTECIAMRHRTIQMKQSILNLNNILKNIQNIANKVNICPYNGECGYDIAVRMEKNKLVYGIYFESPDSKQTSNRTFDIRLFLDKYYQRLKETAPSMFDKIIVYTSYFLNPGDFMSYNNLTEDEVYMSKSLVCNYDTCLILNEATIQKLLVLYSNLPKIEQQRYVKFLEKVKFVNYKTNNYVNNYVKMAYFLGFKIKQPVANPNKINLIVLKQTIEQFNKCLCSANSFLNLNNRKLKLDETTCEGLSAFNVDFIDQLYVKFGTKSQRMWESIFNNDSVQTVLVSTRSTLLSVMKVLDYVRNKGLKFMLLTRKQLRLQGISEEAFHLFFRGKLDVFIIEYDEDMKKCDDVLLSINRTRPAKTGKIITISNFFNNMDQKHLKFTKKHIMNISDNITFMDFDKSSTLSVLSARITFQGHEMNLEDIADEATIKQCVGVGNLEDLIVGWGLQIGKETNCEFKESVYLQRTIRRKSIPDKLLRTNLAKSCLVIVFGKNLDSSSFRFQDEHQDINVNKGILFISDRVEALETYQKYCEELTTTNIYLLEFKNDLFFLESCKTIDSIIIDCLADVPHAEELTLCDLLSREQTSLIIANPGMGKSVLLNYLAIQLKNKTPQSWVVYVNLGNNNVYLKHVLDTMEKFNFTSDILEGAVQLLTFLATGNIPDDEQNHFAIELFKMGFGSSTTKCKYPNYVFLFDAFDEMIENHQKKAICLFRFLKSKNFTVWITSRPHQKRRLEEELQTVALSINPLTDSQMNEYISAYYKTQFIRMPDQGSQNESRTLYSDNKDAIFASCPLHLEHLTRFNQSLKLILILKHFICYKFDLYYQQKVPPKGFKVTKHQESLFTFHQLFALSMCNLANSNILWNLKKKTITQEELFRVGLVTLEDNKPTFMHPYIKAYFIALAAKNNPTFFTRILEEEEYQRVRYVVNSYGNIIQSLEDKGFRIETSWRVDKAVAVLKKLLCEGNKNLAKLLVQTLFKNSTTLLQSPT